MSKQVPLHHAANLAVVVAALSLCPDVAFAVADFHADTSSRSPIARLEIAPDRILVRFKDASTPAQRRTLNTKLSARVVTESRAVSGLQVVRVPSPSTLGATLNAYRRDPNVVYAEPDYRLQFDETLPNDPMFSSLWALRNAGQNGSLAGADINAARAWDITTGRPDVTVAVVDTGVDYDHPDLAANIWVNPGEIAGNGIDDDGNGYVDDVHGINSVSGTGDPMDTYGHGTHVTGTIAAQGNNGIGVAGVSWNAKVIACSLFDAKALSAFVSGAVKCLDYLYDLKTTHGIDIVASNNSWGWIGGSSRALRDAIVRQNDAGILFVAAAGNNGINTAEFAHYPASYTLPNVISVAATDDTDHKAPFSNYGRATVHIAAPGVGVLSTTPGGKYETYSGTSMASPHVVGVLALLKAQDTSRNWIKLKNLLLAGGEVVDSMGFTITGRRLLAAGDNGSGSLTCVNQNVVHRLSPHTDAVILSYGAAQTLDVSALSISCDHAGSAPSVVVAETGQSVAMADNGLHGDSVAGDGVFAGQLSIPQTQIEPMTLKFPNGDDVELSFALNYTPPATSTGQWRDLSSGAHEVFLGDDTAHVLTLPFPLRVGDRADSYPFLVISDNGYAVPATHEAAAYGVFSSGFNLPLPASYFDTIIAPLWDDLIPGTSGRIFWAVRGNAPQRELVIEWRNFSEFFSPASGTVTFQLVLFENDAKILFNYADVTFGDSEVDRGASATVGIQSAAGIDQQFSVDSPQLSDGMSLEWQMPKLDSQSGKKKSWFRRMFLGGMDFQWIAVLGLIAFFTRRRHLLRRV